MININLIIKSPPLVRWRVVLWTGVAFAIVGMLGIAAIGWVTGLWALQSEVAGTKQLLEDYTRAAERLPAAQQQLADMKAKGDLLESLGRNQQFSQSAVARGLLQTPPGVAVTNLTFTEATVKVTGQALSFDAAMRYLDYLKGASTLMGVLEEDMRTSEAGETTFTYLVRIREGGESP